MKNIAVIKQFLHISSANSDTGNLISVGDRLINYNTCIAEWKNKGCVMVNVTKYSSTTSKIQNMLLEELEKSSYEVIQVVNVPIDTQYLWKNKQKM